MISKRQLYRTKISSYLFLTLFKRGNGYFFEIATKSYLPISTIPMNNSESIRIMFKELTGRDFPHMEL